MSSYGLSEQDRLRFSYERCYLCGAEATRGGYDEQHYACGSIYLHAKLHEQSIFCKAHSLHVQQRIATIQGILDACDSMERESVLNAISDYAQTTTFQH